MGGVGVGFVCLSISSSTRPQCGMARPVARSINLPGFGRETGSPRVHVLVLQYGHL